MSWNFYGRKPQLDLMRTLLGGRWFFARITGRRRIGKTELLKQLASTDPVLDERLVYLQVPDSDERDVVATFKQALLDCSPQWIKDISASVIDFPTMARAIGTICRNNGVVVLDEFQYFVRTGLFSFNSFLQSEVDQLRDTACGGLFVLGSIQTEMTALLADKSAPLYGRTTHQLEVDHWDFEDLLQVFNAQNVVDPQCWLTLWSFFEGVPKFYRDAYNFNALNLVPGQMGKGLLSKLFLDGSSPLKDEAENWFLRELQGRNVSIIRYLAASPGCHVGDLAAEVTKSKNSAELGSYLTSLIAKYKMVEKRLPVFADSNSRSARYYLTDNFLQACLAVTTPAVNMAKIRPLDRVLESAMPRLYTHEGYAFEKLIRSLHIECSKKGKGDFSVNSLNLGFWNKPRDMAQNIEIDVVALDEENKKVRFGTCKRSERAHDGASLVEFQKHVDAFLATKEGTRVAGWELELMAFSPIFSPEKRAHLKTAGMLSMDLTDYARYFGH